MMFLLHIAFSLVIITLIAGVVLFTWAKRETGGNPLLKYTGIAVIVLSISNMLCIGYYGARFWEDGYFKAPIILKQGSGMGMMGRGMGNSSTNMMDMMKMMNSKEMMECPMMKDMMKDMMSDKAPSAPNTPTPKPSPDVAPTDSENHEAHH